MPSSVGATCDGWVSTASRLGDVLPQVPPIDAEQDSREAMMTNDERTAPDCSGYVTVDHQHGEAVSVAPYAPPPPRPPADDEKA
jgi:hypothetical protein